MILALVVFVILVLAVGAPLLLATVVIPRREARARLQMANTARPYPYPPSERKIFAPHVPRILSAKVRHADRISGLLKRSVAK